MDLMVQAFGTVKVTRGGQPVANRSRLRRVLLAVLLVNHGRVVPVERLVNALWPARGPAATVASLQIHVHRLRKLLGDTNLVRYDPPGYALVVPRDWVDVHQFEDLAEQGRAASASADVTRAARLLAAATTLYQGQAFAGLDDVQEVAAEAARLAELRLNVIQERVAAELALGAGSSLVAELTTLVTRYPLRERFRAQLMTALYRAGRTAEALEVFRVGRQLLVHELGVEPNAECQALERAILTNRPVL